MPNAAEQIQQGPPMKAVLCKTLEGPAGLVIEDIAEPVVEAGEVMIRVEAVGLNFFDTLITAGKYQVKPPLPFSPGGEVAGTVEAVGAGVTGFKPGARVMAYLGYGGACEKVCVAAERVVALPDGVSSEVGCGIAITYGTAMHGLRERAVLKPGETVLVLGAAGGAGLAAVELAHLMGARVIAAASSAFRLAICREHGAAEGINTAEVAGEAFKDALRVMTGGRGVDVVYDCVGGALAEPSIRALAWGGRYLVVGFASGEIPRLPLNLLLLKGAAAIGVFWGEAVRRDPAAFRADMAFVLAAVAAGRLKPHVHQALPFTQVREALGLLERRQSAGKVVLTFC